MIAAVVAWRRAAAMRLRLRDGDHPEISSAFGARSALQCGSVSGTEITVHALGFLNQPKHAAMRLRLRDGDHCSTRTAKTAGSMNAAMRLRLRDGDHARARRRLACSMRSSLQCGSVSGTEITQRAVGICDRFDKRLQCGSVSGTEITRSTKNVGLGTKFFAAMRLRLRDGDHTHTQARPLHAKNVALQCGSVSGTEITGLDTTETAAHTIGAAMRLRLRDGDHCAGRGR